MHTNTHLGSLKAILKITVYFLKLQILYSYSSLFLFWGVGNIINNFREMAGKHYELRIQNQLNFFLSYKK